MILGQSAGTATALAMGAEIAVQDLAYEKLVTVLAEKEQCLFAALKELTGGSRKSCDSMSPDAVCRCIKSNQGLHHEHYGGACEMCLRSKLYRETFSTPVKSIRLKGLFAFSRKM